MTKQEFYAAIANLIECDEADVRGDLVVKELPNWDSLSVLSFIALADTQWGVAVSGADVAKCRIVDDLAALFPGKIAG